MRHVIAGLCALVLAATPAWSLKKVNGREIPEESDFTGHGSSFMNNIGHYDTLLSETARLLSSTEGTDGIDVDQIRGNPDVDSIQGNPVVDSLTCSYVADAAGVILPLRATKLTFGIPAVSSETDSAFTSASNTTEQTIAFKGADYIPALARIVDIVIHCTDSVTHTDSATATTMAFDIGSTDGGTEYVDGTNDETDDITSYAADGLGHVVPSAATASVYVGGTPGQNWEDLVRGKWAMYIIWYDLSDL